MSLPALHPALTSLTQLVIIRHGEAEVYATSDHQRPLTARAHQQLQRTREGLISSLTDRTSRSALVWVSDARRTQETWHVLTASPLPLDQVQVCIRPDLYLASAQQLSHHL